MRILLDNNIHVDLANCFPGNEVKHCRDLGWQRLLNGELVRLAAEEFDVLITIDKNMPYQTSLKRSTLAVVVFDVRDNTLEELSEFAARFINGEALLAPGNYIVLKP